MIIPITQLKEILAAGGSLVLDGSIMTLSDLKQLATEAAKAKVTITINNVANITQDHLKQIASIAPGLIIFDLT